MGKIRLNKFIALSGITSRRKADILIEEGRVKVNGEVVTKLGITIDPEKDTVVVDGKRINLPTKKVYLAFNKPRGYVTTMDDELGRKNIAMLFSNFPVRVFPVGRLDMDTEGLLLLTNDGEFAHIVTHPRFDIEKEYLAWVEGVVEDEEIKRLKKGVFVEGRVVKPKSIEILKTERRNTILKVIIKEGRKREVRRMFHYIGHDVTKLVRTRIGPVKLGKLKSGKYRDLTPSEIEWFFNKKGVKG